ncbi:MAG: ATP-binding protein [Oscillospiraceae bacterium]|nr:ATP-binding protein [Oscillospiraceae bacterium]
MSVISFPVRKVWFFMKSNAKVPIVFAAIFLLILIGLITTTRTLDQKLLAHVEETTSDMQALLSAMMSETVISVNFIAETIEDMIERGDSFEDIQKYMTLCSSDEFKEQMHTNSYLNVFGYFDEFDAFFDGLGLLLPEGLIANESHWYIEAVEKNGEVALSSQVYIDLRFEIPVLYYSRCLFDSRGNRLGVIAMNVPVSFFQDYIIGGHFSESSYGFITDNELRVVIHPGEDMVGEFIHEANLGLDDAKSLIEQGKAISLYEYVNYLGDKALLFCRQLNNGWYIFFSVPKSEYYKDLYDTMTIMIIVGLVIAAALGLLLVRIDAAKNKANIKNQQKSNFLAVMSHEIRTPMNAIMGIAEAQLQEEERELTPSIKEAFDRIYYSGSLLMQIINDLLDISKIEAGKLDIIADRYEVASLVNEVVQLNKIRFDSRPIEFILHVDENIPASLIGDELRIKQILNNLLSNAFKYTWKGEVEFSITSSVSEEDKSIVFLILTVRDTGMGISQQDIKNLFDQYARFNMKANRSTEGTGLGLSIAKNLISMMQGEITVESKLEKGTKFTVRLPQKINGSKAVLGKAVVENLYKLQFSSVSHVKKAPILRERMPYGSVLIVDDVEMNLFVAKLLMRPYELEIHIAGSGYDAVQKVKDGNQYDVIFMDHMMPKMDGIEAVKIIRELGYQQSIIALTANAVSGQADIFLSNGFDDFISKPIDIRVLNAVLNKYIRDKNTDRKAEYEKTQSQKAHDGQETEKDDSYTSFDISRLEHISGLNAAQGLNVFEDDEDDYISALRSFIKSASGIIEKLKDVKKDNLSEYVINVHGLKSVSAWICAEEIREKALELELLAKEGDLSGVLERNGAFLNKVVEFISELSVLFEDDSLTV